MLILYKVKKLTTLNFQRQMELTKWGRGKIKEDKLELSSAKLSRGVRS